jgi:hypothetical protein
MADNVKPRSEFDRGWAKIKDKIPEYMRDDVYSQLRAKYDARVDPETPENKLIDLLETNKTENRETVDSLLSETLPAYEGLSGTAIDSTKAGLAGLQDAEAGIEDVAMPDYVGDLVSKAGGAKADKRDIKAQRNALGKLEALTDPEVTAKEQYLKEVARQQQERDMRSYMDAQLSNLEARGARSGGAEIAALLGGQQMTGNNRMMQDLATNAGAVDRSMRALEGYGNLATTMRGQGFDEDFKTKSALDSVGQFNKGLKQDFDTKQTQLKLAQNDQTWGREKDVYQGGREATGDIYNYGAEPLRAAERGAGMKIGVNQSDTNSLGGGFKFMSGKQSADKAADILEDDDDGILGILGL